MKKILSLVLVIFSSPSKAATALGLSAAAISSALGFDPFTWVLGAVGASIVLIKTEHKSRAEDVANAVISVFLAGVVAPWGAEAAKAYLPDAVANNLLIYALAFGLSAGWPLLYKFAEPLIKRKLGE